MERPSTAIAVSLTPPAVRVENGSPVGDVPLVDLRAQHRRLRGELQAAFERVLDSGGYSSGREVAGFEAALAERLGVGHVVGVASGTAALHLALVAAGIGPGDEVVVPPNSFFATAGAVLAAGATPLFADVDVATATLDPAAVEAAITRRTAAVVAVHLYGQPADMDALASVARRHGLLLVEDAAQAFGAAWRGRPIGSVGDVAAFSFYPTKNLGGLGEGGAVTTGDSALARRVRMLRNHGEETKNEHVLAGLNERLDELQAAFLAVKLRHVDRWLEQRRRAVVYYRRLLENVEAVGLLTAAPAARPAPHLFVVRVERRDDVLARLRTRGIGAAVHYPTPIHLQPACRHLGAVEGSLPRAEALARTVLSLPLYPEIGGEDIERSVAALRDVLEERR